MSLLILSKRGQAVTEMAILGSLILLAFMVLLKYGQTLTAQQEAQMYAFRQALKSSYNENNAVSYTVAKDKRVIDLFGKYDGSQKARLTAGASVMWMNDPGLNPKEDEDDAPKQIYEFNGKVVGVPPMRIKVRGDEEDYWVYSPASIWDMERDRETTLSPSLTYWWVTRAPADVTQIDEEGVTRRKVEEVNEKTTTRLKVMSEGDVERYSVDPDLLDVSNVPGDIRVVQEEYWRKEEEMFTPWGE